MRYYLFLNSFIKMVKIAKAFSRKLAVPRYMSTSVVPKLYILRNCNQVYVFDPCPKI